MTTGRGVIEFEIDPIRLPQLQIQVTADDDAAILAAASALAGGDAARALELHGSATGSQPTLLHRLSFALALYSVGRHSEARTAATALIAGMGASPIFLLIQSACLDREDRPWAAVDTLLAAAQLALGLTATGRSADEQKADILDRLPSTPSDTLRDATFVSIGQNLSRLGAFESCKIDLTPSLDRAAAKLGARGDLGYRELLNVLLFLGLAETTAPDWQDVVFERVAAPLLRSLVAAGRGEVALQMEPEIYTRHVKTRETAEHFGRCYDVLAPILRDAGRRAGVGRRPVGPATVKTRYRVAFIAPQLSDLAHVHVALDILACIHGLERRRIDGVLIGVAMVVDAIKSRAALLGVPTIAVPDLHVPGSTAGNLLLKLADYLAAEHFDAAVWVSIATYSAYAFGLPLAPVQIFWALKYHSFKTPDVDGYLTTGAIDQTWKNIDGRAWRAAQPVVSNLFDPSLTDEARKIRSRFGDDKIIIGCIGREEKINSPEFLETVATILRRRPDATFLWTGRSRLEDIELSFQHHDVHAQTVYIGWVDSRLYAQVIDIFLDSFPFPCGHTALQAMAAGKPVVFLDSVESRQTGIPMYIQPILAGTAGSPESQARMKKIFGSSAPAELFPLTGDAAAYAHFVERLIADRSWRQSVGDANQAFVTEFMNDREACGRTFTRHIVEIIEQKCAAKTEVRSESSQG